MTFELPGKQQRVLEDELSRGDVVEVRFSATSSVDVFFVDDPNLNKLRHGKHSEQVGHFKMISATMRFVAPRAGKWNLVVGNPENQPARVTIDAIKHGT